MTATRPPRRRAGRSSAAAAETLQRLTAARADLDAAVVERRRREDALIEQYAAASGEIADVVARRDAALADLDRRTREIRDAAAAELAEIQARQQQVLVELNHHRTPRGAVDLVRGTGEAAASNPAGAPGQVATWPAAVTDPTTWPSRGRRARRAWQRCRWPSRPRRPPHPMRQRRTVTGATCSRTSSGFAVARIRPAPSRAAGPG